MRQAGESTVLIGLSPPGRDKGQAFGKEFSYCKESRGYPFAQNMSIFKKINNNNTKHTYKIRLQKHLETGSASRLDLFLALQTVCSRPR